MHLSSPLLSVAELTALPADQRLLVDCRFDLADPARGEHDYLAGHIPGALYAHLDRDLSDLSRQAEGLGRHPLPLPQVFAATLARWGWRPGLLVVAYDAAGGALAAARLWWLLRLAGYPQAAVLDGGWPAWQASGLPVEAGETTRAPTEAPALAWDASRMLDHADVQRRLGQGALLDARAAPRYRGEVEPIDRIGGHVPGALNRPFADNLQGDGRFKPVAQLRMEFDALLAGHAVDQVVHMCGSGVTACHNLLAMEQAGLHGSRLYPASWSGWISDPARPVATG